MDASSAVLFLFALLSITPDILHAQESCVTPNNQPGICIKLNNCQILVQMAKKKPLSRSDLSFIRNSQCGFDSVNNMIPNVCCPGLPNLNLLPEQCGDYEEDRIVGGEKTDLGEHPWLALLQYERSNRKSFNCGGVLISSRYVMTAAHCVSTAHLPPNFKLVAVRLGEHDTNTNSDCIGTQCTPPPLDFKIESTIVHELYTGANSAQPNDIALLRLASTVEFTEYIKPICLPTPTSIRNTNLNGQYFTAAGWGRTESGFQSSVKLKVSLPYMGTTQCAGFYQAQSIPISSNQLCAGGVDGKDTCTGDSGGPLMIKLNVNNTGKWYAIGIISFGPSPCGTAGWPGVYTRVSEFMSWILTNIRA